MASCLVASPTSRLSSAQRGAECRLPVFHAEKQRNYQRNRLGITLQKYFHLPVRTATRSPLTAWKINTSYAIAAWMIGQTKLVIPLISCSNKFQHGKRHHYSIAKLVIASWLSPFITRLLTVLSPAHTDCSNNKQNGGQVNRENRIMINISI